MYVPNRRSKNFVLTVAAGTLLALPLAAHGQLPPAPRPGDGDRRPVPKLFVVQRVQDLGKLLEGEKPTVEWRLENRGAADLLIERTRAPCGCTVVQLEDEDKVIPPGSARTLRVVFDTTGRPGMQNKAVHVETNDPAEPSAKLELTATVESLYHVVPPGLVNIQNVRRGERASRSIDIYPAEGRNEVQIINIETPAAGPIRFSHEPLTVDPTAPGAPPRERRGTGRRVSMTVAEHVGLGPFTTRATLKLSVDGIVREHPVSVLGQVVADLTWHPRILDETRFPSRPGKRFEPLRLESTDAMPFEIVEARAAGPWFDVSFDAVRAGRPGTSYAVVLTLRDDAPPGPFGTMLEVRTSLPDQPVVRVPVFGIVAEPVEVDPPLIVLRQDGTEHGTRRRIKLQAAPQESLEVLHLESGHPALAAAVDEESSARYRHIRFLNVRLIEELPQGVHEAAMKISTNVSGAEKITVPVRIEVPAAGASRAGDR